MKSLADRKTFATSFKMAESTFNQLKYIVAKWKKSRSYCIRNCIALAYKALRKQEQESS